MTYSCRIDDKLCVAHQYLGPTLCLKHLPVFFSASFSFKNARYSCLSPIFHPFCVMPSKRQSTGSVP